MGIVKTEAQRKANRLRRERAVAASDTEAIRGAETGRVVSPDAGICVYVIMPG